MNEDFTKAGIGVGNGLTERKKLSWLRDNRYKEEKEKAQKRKVSKINQ